MLLATLFAQPSAGAARACLFAYRFLPARHAARHGFAGAAALAAGLSR